MLETIVAKHERNARVFTFLDGRAIGATKRRGLIADLGAAVETAGGFGGLAGSCFGCSGGFGGSGNLLSL